MKVLGIDPGQSGGIAQVESPRGFLRGETMAWKMPDTERDIWDLLNKLGSYFPRVDHVYLEAVHAMPKQGVSSTFKFGMNYGFLRGCLIALGIPFETVTPHKWQQALGCLTKGDKNISKKKAQELYPNLKITHALADCLLIATYGQRMQG